MESGNLFSKQSLDMNNNSIESEENLILRELQKDLASFTLALHFIRNHTKAKEEEKYNVMIGLSRNVTLEYCEGNQKINEERNNFIKGDAFNRVWNYFNPITPTGIVDIKKAQQNQIALLQFISLDPCGTIKAMENSIKEANYKFIVTLHTMNIFDSFLILPEFYNYFREHNEILVFLLNETFTNLEEDADLLDLLTDLRDNLWELNEIINTYILSHCDADGKLSNEIKNHTHTIKYNELVTSAFLNKSIIKNMISSIINMSIEDGGEEDETILHIITDLYNQIPDNKKQEFAALCAEDELGADLFAKLLDSYQESTREEIELSSDDEEMESDGENKVEDLTFLNALQTQLQSLLVKDFNAILNFMLLKNGKDLLVKLLGPSRLLARLFEINYKSDSSIDASFTADNLTALFRIFLEHKKKEYITQLIDLHKEYAFNHQFIFGVAKELILLVKSIINNNTTDHEFNLFLENVNDELSSIINNKIKPLKLMAYNVVATESVDKPDVNHQPSKNSKPYGNKRKADDDAGREENKRHDNLGKEEMDDESFPTLTQDRNTLFSIPAVQNDLVKEDERYQALFAENKAYKNIAQSKINPKSPEDIAHFYRQQKP